MRKLMLVVTGIALLSLVPGISYADADDVYVVGIKRSWATTPERLADAIDRAGLFLNTSHRCFVQSTLIGINKGEPEPTHGFHEPVIMELTYELKVDFGATVCGSEPVGECRPGKTIYYCTSEEEQAEGLQEAINAHWRSDPAFELVITQRNPTPGVRVGN